MFQNIDKDRQYIKWITKNENILYCFVVEFRDESMYWDKNFIHIPNLVDDKIIFLNATHTVSIYNRNTLTHIESHCIILLGAILLILLPCVILSLINCSSSFLVVFCTSCCVFKRTVMLIYFYYEWNRSMDTSTFCSRYKKYQSC